MSLVGSWICCRTAVPPNWQSQISTPCTEDETSSVHCLSDLHHGPTHHSPPVQSTDLTHCTPDETKRSIFFFVQLSKPLRTVMDVTFHTQPLSLPPKGNWEHRFLSFILVFYLLFGRFPFPPTCSIREDWTQVTHLPKAKKTNIKLFLWMWIWVLINKICHNVFAILWSLLGMWMMTQLSENKQINKYCLTLLDHRLIFFSEKFKISSFGRSLKFWTKKN